MKKMYLLCNAHLDPVWLWRKSEGVAEALSTFRIAADFCEQYDGFIFNHNEALLYEWVEEHDHALFERIRALVKQGKWAIMGGWYLQPDCLMPCGESLFSQIELGQAYFRKKFGIIPTTAINFDPFGHSRGLVQIMKQCGYDSYIMMRPMEYDTDFWWEGFDGSRIAVTPIYQGYLSKKGEALPKIQHQLQAQNDRESALCLWGIGNHGGGPSHIDLEQIEAFRKTSNVELIHATAEDYFAALDKTSLPVIKQSLIPRNVGCYTTMVQIKQANRRLENKIAVTEKILSYAALGLGRTFDTADLLRAKKALAFCQFHDILPGTSIRTVEEESLRTLHFGEELVDQLYEKAFFCLCKGQKKAREGEIPILLFNPHPYAVEGDFEVGFILQNQNWNADEYTYATVYSASGEELATQNEKPDSTFHLDWPKKISFHATLAPSCINRFDARLSVQKLPDVRFFDDSDPDRFTICNARMRVSISKKTGLIELYEVDGKTILQNSGVLETYNDNEDPWGMTVQGFTDYTGSFSLMRDAEVNEMIGYPNETTANVRIVEDGAVRTKIQAFFSYRRSTAMVEYTISHQGSYIDVDIVLQSQEPNRMIKYRLDTAFSGTPMGDCPFGCETLFHDEKESTFQKWCGIVNSTSRLYAVNRGIYGGSFTESCMKISLLRTPVYSAHPIQDRQLAPHDRMLDHIDIGERRFSLRLTTEPDVERIAQTYNESPMPLSFFPSGQGSIPASAIVIDETSILLSTIRQADGDFTIRLYNTQDRDTDATVQFPCNDRTLPLHFTEHEIKTLHFSPNDEKKQ